MKQIKFRDDEGIFGGILTDEGNIICACCGGITPFDEIDGYAVEILEVYDDWVDFSFAIID